MIGIGQDIIDLFSGLGDVGMLIAIAVIIWIDGTAFPTLPEAWIIFILGTNADSFWWGASIVLVASFASLAGNFTLYALVRTAKLPKRVQKAMKAYTNWLILKDERLLLLNRFAPLLPYTGAFIAACNWNLKKCTVYILVSAVAKFSMYVIIFWLSFETLRAEVAPWVSLAIVLIVVLASVIASITYKKRQTARREPERSQ